MCLVAASTVGEWDMTGLVLPIEVPIPIPGEKPRGWECLKLTSGVNEGPASAWTSIRRDSELVKRVSSESESGLLDR
jgi:hypothetical protein